MIYFINNKIHYHITDEAIKKHIANIKNDPIGKKK